MPETTYIILRGNTETEAWDDIHPGISARSADQAVKAAIEHHGSKYGNGIYVAVPQRSWKPVTVTVETKTVLNLSEEPGGGTSP